MASAYASLARSGPARYLVCSKVFSSAKIWWPEKVGRVCFFPLPIVVVAVARTSEEPTVTAAWNAEMSQSKRSASYTVSYI